MGKLLSSATDAAGAAGSIGPREPKARLIDEQQGHRLELSCGLIPGGTGYWSSTISQTTEIPLSPDDRWSFYVHLYTLAAEKWLSGTPDDLPAFSARINGRDHQEQDLTLEMKIWAGLVAEHAGIHYLIWLPEGWSIQHLSGGWNHWMFTSDALTSHFPAGMGRFQSSELRGRRERADREG